MIRRALKKWRNVVAAPYRVVDEVLQKPDLAALQTYYQECRSTFMRIPGSSPIFSQTTEDPEEETRSHFWISPALRRAAGIQKKLEILRQRGVSFDPFGGAMDAFASAVVPHLRSNVRTCGKEGRHWVAIMFKSYAYGPGTCAPWHSDGRKYSGAFVYYYHDAWQHEWGGNLLIASRRSTFWRGKPRTDLGTFVFPQPNRLVLIGPETLHTVDRVSAAASCRLSIAGFLMTPQSAHQILENVAESSGADA